MNREAFKQRMQLLKSYREQNPGKGYFDWKAQQLADGGEVEQVRNAIEQAKVATGIPNQFLDNWNSKRLSTGKFDSQLGNGLIDIQKANRDSAAIYESPTKYGKSAYLRGTPLIKSAGATTEEAELQLLEDAAQFGRSTRHRLSGNANQRGLVGTQRIKGEYNPAGNAIYAPTQDVLTHEQSHASKAVPQEQRIQEILGGSNTGSTDYLDRPTEVYSRLMELREANQLDPLKVWEKKDIKALKKTGIDYDILNRYKDEDILELFNTVADNSNYDIPMVADGGEIPPYIGGYNKKGQMVLPVNRDLGMQNVTTPQVTITPKDNIDLTTVIDRGRKAFGDVGREVLANTTPFGDVESAVYTYDAIKNKDWLGMGLAAVGMLPFVPNLGRARRINKLPKRDIPTVHKNLAEDKINEVLKQRQRKVQETLYPEVTIDDRSDVANAVNRVVESLDTKAYSRARKVDAQYGTNYTGAYDELRKNYDNMSQFEVVADRNLDRDMRGARGRTKLNDDAAFDLAVEGKPIDDIRRYQIAVKPGEATEAVVHHEMSHITDLMQQKGYDMSKIHDNKLLRALEDNDNFLDDSTLQIIFPGINIPEFRNYQRTGSELKSFMNQTRKSMEQKGIIKRLTEPINQKQLEKYMKDMPFNSSENVIYRSFKDPQTYLKWMNTIPVVGLAPAAINRFYTNNNFEK